MSDKVRQWVEYGTTALVIIVGVGLLALTAKMDDRYVQKEQYRQDRDLMREDVKEIRQDIKELLRRSK